MKADASQALPRGTSATAPARQPGQFALLRQRRFAPFFWTQFAGAANDNLFKFAFTVLVTYQLQGAWLAPALAGLVIGALFILPFVLFSATAGQLADKYDKARLVRFVKNLEIAIMLVAAGGFLTGQVPVLLLCTFLMGLHSTLFGPVKFAYLPQVLGERELTGGTGMVEMGTFVAILLGNVAGGLLVALPGVGRGAVAGACVLLALAGRALAQAIPALPATDPGLRIRWNPITETWRNLQLARGNRAVFHALLGISWMWFFGAVFLGQFPSFAKEVLHGNAQVASLLLVVFSIGIGTGSLLCEVLGRRQVETGLVPLGAIGMSVFAIDLYFAARGLPASALMGVGAFLARPAHWRVLADLLLLSLSAGLYSVPLYALIQLRSAPTHRARTIAANNILNALFMVASALLAGALLSAGRTAAQVFLLTGMANALVAGCLFWRGPEYLLRFVAWAVARCICRLQVHGDEHLPSSGAAVVLVCRPAGLSDALLVLLLVAASPRPLCFVLDQHTLRTPVLGWLLRRARQAIAAAAQTENPQVAGAAGLERAAQVLKAGHLLAMFPQGSATSDGQRQPSMDNTVQVLQRAQADGCGVPVIAMALARQRRLRLERTGQGGALVRLLRRGRLRRMVLNVAPAMPASQATPEALRGRVAELCRQGLEKQQ